MKHETLPQTARAGETLKDVQICPFGDYPHGDDIQHCTRAAFERVISDWCERGANDILVDFEHQSEADDLTSDTSAAAWITNLRIDPERGLVGDFKLTDLGADALTNRRLRFLSVSWLVHAETLEPVRIMSVALTNKPNIPVSPILNKEKPGSSTVEEKDPSMEKIKEMLGLTAEATEEDIAAAIATLQEAQRKAEEAALEQEAETFAAENEKKCNKAVIKALYLANKETAKTLVAAIPAPGQVQRLLNRAPNAAPAQKCDLIKELNKLPVGEERIQFVKAHASEFADAAK